MNAEAMASQESSKQRTRRSSDQVRSDALSRQDNLKAKVSSRAERLEKQLQAARKRELEIENRKQMIASNTSTRAPKEPIQTIKDTVKKRVERELATFIKELGAKHELNFDSINPRVTRQGSGISFHIAGTVQGVKAAVRAVGGATREAARFTEHYKMIGLSKNLLNKEVELKDTEGNVEGKYKVLGLKGRAHDVVLQKVDSEETMLMPAADFRTRLVAQ